MTVKWSPLAVSNELDQIQQELDKARVPLEAAYHSASKATQIAGLPQYMLWYLKGLAETCRGASSSVQYRVDTVRGHLPKADLDKERQDLAERIPLV